MNRLIKIGLIGALFILPSCVYSKKESGETISAHQDVAAEAVVDVQGRVLYEVLPADTLNSIAVRFNTTPRNIIELNNLKKPYGLRPGQLINVPNNQDFIADTPQEPIAIKISPKLK